VTLCSRLIAVRCEPQTGVQVAIAQSPRKDFFPGQLVKERKWENLGGSFKEVRWDKMEGKNFLNKMELLMSSLTSSQWAALQGTTWPGTRARHWSASVCSYKQGIMVTVNDISFVFLQLGVSDWDLRFWLQCWGFISGMLYCVVRWVVPDIIKECWEPPSQWRGIAFQKVCLPVEDTWI